MNHPCKEGLILAAQSGDTVAFNRLLLVCQTDARRYARRHCGASDIDDAVQETLLILSRKVKGLRAAAAFSGWLFTIVRRECQRLSRRMFGQDVSIEDLADSQLETRSDESLHLDLIAALESLPAHYLEVILLRDFAELTISEMAEKLGMQVPGVKSRLHRARTRARVFGRTDFLTGMALLVPQKPLVSSPGDRYGVNLFPGPDRLADGRHGSGDHGRRERKRRLPTSSTTNATDAPEIHALLVARSISIGLR